MTSRCSAADAGAGVDDARELGRCGAVVARPVAGADDGHELPHDREVLAAGLRLRRSAVAVPSVVAEELQGADSA